MLMRVLFSLSASPVKSQSLMGLSYFPRVRRAKLSLPAEVLSVSGSTTFDSASLAYFKGKYGTIGEENALLFDTSRDWFDQGICRQNLACFLNSWRGE